MSSTIRVERRERFSIVDRRALVDDRLSFKAKGLLAYMIGLPDGSTVTRDDLAAVGPDGVTTVRSGLKELVDAGYITRTKTRLANGQMVTESVLFEYPPEVGNPPSVPEVGYPTTGKPTTKREEPETEEQHSLPGVDTPGPFFRTDGIPVALDALPLGQYPEQFLKTWEQYPKARRVEKRGVYAKWRATIEREHKMTRQDPMDIMRMLYHAVVRYARARKGEDDTYTMQPARFFGPGEPWRDHLVDAPVAAERKEWQA